ncbi:hypothetical protein K437DRAFT_272354 [Tilletiaria anomala UBC 951]|uniref:Cyclin-like domain-containing protein n=1 Tax=Tilletiaria anomala (strain ATCC 24038 / CBS 436.72 / UBC 951) TaxID=1037660 RepID=A0A066WFA0_TILAU|nr:uncharacterized protein K437DRAFT_272354 [Tilletiaria anomala UBC 951]KDN52657.1 hypothetical protein K437DRAFT_272354 [Tilletiaria anomala UBC 951]
MTANFWSSTHAQRWIFTRSQLLLAREEDLRYATPEEVGAIGIWGANVISTLSKRMQLRQRVSATATVFFKRFYAKNSYCATDLTIVIAACVYVAAKVEESPVHVRSVFAEASRVFADMSSRSFPTAAHAVAEMEFYLLEELEFDLILHHPYRTLAQIASTIGNINVKDSKISAVNSTEKESLGPSSRKRKHSRSEQDRALRRARHASQTDRELIIGGSVNNGSIAASDAQDIDEEPCLEDFDDSALQMAWFVLNDTYRSDIPLLYPPHLIAIASVLLALVLHPPASEKLEASISQMQSARNAWEQSKLHNQAIRPGQDGTTSDASGNPGALSPQASRIVGLGIDNKATPITSDRLDHTASNGAVIRSFAAQVPSTTSPVASTPGSVGSMFTSSGNTPANTPGVATHPQLGAGQPTATVAIPHQPPVPPPDTLTVLASLNVSMPLVAEIVQEILSSYELWNRVGSSSGSSSATGGATAGASRDKATGKRATLHSASDKQGEDIVGNGRAMMKRLERMREARRRDILARGKS